MSLCAPDGTKTEKVIFETKLKFQKYVSVLSHAENLSMAAFQRMHVSPAKQSDVSLPRKCDYQTE